MTTTRKWSDEMRAQLLLKYKDKIDNLGEEEFFRQFDQIREECQAEIESFVPSLVAFGGYQCGCTLALAEKTLSSIPEKCPIHNKPLYGPPSWEENPNNCPLGLEEHTDFQERQRLIHLIVESVTEDEPVKAETMKTTKRTSLSDSILNMEDI